MIEILITRLKKVKSAIPPNGIKEQYTACCPAHDDRHRSLSIAIDNSGKILLKCHAGCTVADICQAVGISLKDLMPTNTDSNGGLTVAQLAVHKEISETTLKEYGCIDWPGSGRPFVQITYRHPDGTPASRQRKRWGLSGNKNSSWLPGNGNPIAYGLWRPITSNVLVICEGESDCWVLWDAGFQAIGIPGADMTGKLITIPTQIDEIFIIKEPDKGGKIFEPGIKKRLETLGYKGKVFVMEMEKYKDPSDWHIKSINFKAEFTQEMETIRKGAISTPTCAEMAEKEYAAQPKEPEPLPSTLPIFPIDIFPDPIADYCRAVAQSISCPVDYLGMATLAALSILVGESEIEIKSDWSERPNLYLGIVAPPGNSKTPATNAIMGLSLYEIEEGYAERNAQTERDHERDLAIFDVGLQRWKAELKGLPKGSAPPDMPAKPEPPLRHEIYTTDATTEALAEMLANNPAGILLMKDELTALVKGLNQYKNGEKGADREFFLSSWSGAPTKVNRKGKAPVVIPRPRISIFGGIVPENLRLLAGGKKDGFFERFFCGYPAPVARKFDGKSVDAKTKEVAAQAFKNAMISRKVKMEPGAQMLFGVFFEDHFAGEVEGYVPKLVSMAARFALLLCCAHMTDVCTPAIMANALRLAEYAEAHIRRVNHAAGISEEMHETNAVLEYCVRKKLTLVKVRDLYVAGVAGCTSAKATREKMQELVEIEQAVWEKPGKILRIGKD